MIDLEASLSRVLRADPAVVAIIGDRCWLTMPRNPTFPAVLIYRIAGAPTPTWQQTILGDDGDFDLHCYGGSRVDSLGLAQAAMSALCGASNRMGVTPYNVLHLPDSDLPQEGGRDRERYIVTLRAFASHQEATL